MAFSLALCRSKLKTSVDGENGKWFIPLIYHSLFNRVSSTPTGAGLLFMNTNCHGTCSIVLHTPVTLHEKRKETQTNRQTNTPTKQTNKQTNKQANKQTMNQSSEQTSKQTKATAQQTRRRARTPSQTQYADAAAVSSTG